MPRRIELVLVSAVPALRVCVCDGDFYRFRVAGRTDLQTIQRLARCGPARKLLLPGTLSLPAIAYDVAITGFLAVLARRHGVETDETKETAIGRHRLTSRLARVGWAASCTTLFPVWTI